MLTKATRRILFEREGRSQSESRQLPCLSGTRGTANPVNECYEVGAVLIRNGGEFQTQTAVGNGVLNDSFGPNLAFGDEKIDSCSRSQRPRDWRGEEHTTHAQVANA